MNLQGVEERLCEEGGAGFAGIDRNPKNHVKAMRLRAWLEDHTLLGGWAVLQGCGLLNTALEITRS